MKNRIFRPILTIIVTVLTLTGCFNSPGNYQSGWGFATIVSSGYGNTLFLLDGPNKVYYSAQEVSNSKDPLYTGDRIYIQTFTIDRDNQPEGTLGTEKNPILMTDVYFEKIAVEDPIERSEATDQIKNDKLKTITALGVTASNFRHDYLNIGVAYFRSEDAGYDFRLIHDRTSNDTLFYTFKATNKADDKVSTKLVNSMRSYQLPVLPDECHVAVRFKAESYPQDPNYRFIDSTYIMPFKRPTLE